VIGVEALTFADGTTRILDVAPTGVADHFAGTGTAAIAGNVLINDGHAAGTSLTAALVGQAPQHGTVTLSTNGQFSYVANTGYVGKDFFIYQASDGYAASNPVLVTLTMAPVGAIVASNDSYTLSAAGNTLTQLESGGLLANDLQVGTVVPLTVSAVNGKALAAGSTVPVATLGGGTVTVSANGAFTYTAAAGAPAGTVDKFTYTVSDGSARTDVGVVTITVHPGNGGPSLAPVTISGNVADGYISGATVFADANGNGVADPGEATATTDAQGAYTLIRGSGILVATGGIDVSTGLAFTGRFEAPEGSTAITPLTTLAVALGGTQTAGDQLKKALSLSSAIDLTHFDPVAGTQAGTAGAKQVFLAGVAVADTETMVASALEGLGVIPADAARAAFDSIATQVRMAALSVGHTLDLTAMITLDTILHDSAGRVGVTLDPVLSSAVVMALHDSNTALYSLEKEDGPTLLKGVGWIAKDAQAPSGVAGKSFSFNYAFSNAVVEYRSGAAWLTGPDGKAMEVTGAATLKFTDGTIQENDGKPLVDDLFYFAKNLDVWKAHMDAGAHYAQYGWHEGRDPNAFFSTQDYLAANPDVAAAKMNPLDHYDQYGWHEGRDPSAAFSTKAYLAANPDVAAAHMDPLQHYLQYGLAEGRAA